jgi:hypothetical protein
MGRPEAPSASTFVSGAVSGVVSRTCVAPLDRLSTLQQVGCRATATAASSVSALGALYRRHGFAALFQGNTANAVRVPRLLHRHSRHPNRRPARRLPRLPHCA